MSRSLPLALVAVALAFSTASAYIHFPPKSLPKLCQDSTDIRILSVKKFDKESGVIVYEVEEVLKDSQSKIESFKHVLRLEREETEKILVWAAKGKKAVAFTIEAKPQKDQSAMGYIFIDENCYSVNYDAEGKYWAMIRVEPALGDRYLGTVEGLQKLTKASLAGQEVKVPTNATKSKEDDAKRFEEVNEALERTQKK